jgi:hypothetical protein
MDRLNMFIDLHQLHEIRRNGPKFTWTTKQINPTMVTPDMILVSTEWESKYPLCFGWTKTRAGSDHWTILLDSREGAARKHKYFFFEKQWILELDLKEVFSKMWKEASMGDADNRYSSMLVQMDRT